MDPAEEIVSLWLKQQGYFSIPNIKIPKSRGKEVDFLTLKLEDNGEVKNRVHIEVHASVSPLGPLRPWSPAKYNKMPIEDRVKYYYRTKFIGPTVEGTGELKNNCIEDLVINVFKFDSYEKWLVLGRIHKYDTKEGLVNEFQKYNVKVFFLEDVLKRISFTGTARDRTGRFVQLLAATLTDEAQYNLLKKK